MESLKKSCYFQLDEQIQAFYEHSRISDSLVRVKFFACEQVELMLRGLFPRAKVLPFGSSVNSFGKSGGDLDMCIQFDSTEAATPTSRLNFLARPSYREFREHCQQMVRLVTPLIRECLPGCCKVLELNHARVPIIKYQQQFLNLECDICMSST